MDNYLRDRFRVVGAIAIVVAVITFFVLSFASSKEKYETAIVLKTLNSEIIQALLNSKNDNGIPGDWGWKNNSPSTKVIMRNFFKYLNVSSYCLDFDYGCFPVGGYSSLSGKNIAFNPMQYPSVQLSNGISIAVQAKGNCRKYNSVCALVYVDVNGADKPNVFGKDLFVFTIINNDTGCNSNSESAMNCAAVISKNNWKIDSEYPW